VCCATSLRSLAGADITGHHGEVRVEEQSLVGRESELVALTGLIEDARAGRGRVALVLGEPGIGKTRLAEAAQTMARQSGFDVSWGRCLSVDMPSYWPWKQVLINLLGETDLLDQGRFASRPELFAAVAETIEARTRTHAVLVIFEDAHWADPGSLALLEFLTGVVPGQRLMLLVTARDEAAPLPMSAGIRRLPLSGLDPEGTAALVRHIVGHQASQDYIAEVHRRTGGNPFFTSEVARLQLSRGTPTGAIPPGVRQVLEQRLARLHQKSFELLQVASVVGSPHIGILAEITGLPAENVAALLDEAAAAGVIVNGAFAHDLMRETLYLGISPGRRAALHREVAEHLQGGGPAELARHWSLASGEDAQRHAAELALVAGDMAVARLAHEQAIGHYRMALEIGVGGLDVQRRLGEAQVQAGHIAAGRKTLRKVAWKAREAGVADVLTRAVLAMGGGVGGFEVDILDVEQGPLLEEALRLLPEGDSALRAAVLARLSIASAGTTSAEKRAGLAEDAANMARRVGDADAEVAALAAFCDARSGPAHVHERVEAAGRMLALAQHHALLELLGRRLRLRARLELGDLTGVDSDIAAYARVADRLRSPTYGWLVPLWRGMRAVIDGDLDAGSRYADEVAALAETAQSSNAEMMSWTLRWRIARLRQDTIAIGKLVGRMEEWAEKFPGSADCTFALLFAEAGDPDRGRWHLRRLMAAGLESLPVDSEWVELLWLLGEAAMLLDERDAARAVHDALEPYAALWAVDGYGGACFGQVSELLGRLAEYLGRPVAAPPGRSAFVRTGTVWQLAFRGRSATVVDSKGMRDLAILLGRPGQEVYVLDLVEEAGGPSRAAAGHDTGPMIDATARSAYRRRLVDLQEEIDEASRDHDQGRLEKLQAEKDYLAAELAAAFGLGGRVRITGDRTERARKAVAMRIGTALKAIETVHPELARHLRNSVSTGRFCSYRPDQELTWQLADTT
jgi:AAA ATPase domain